MIAAMLLSFPVSLLSALSRPRRAALRRLGWGAALLLPVAVAAAPVINTPATSFTAAESGRTFMTVGDVWNGSAKVGSTTGDTFSVTYTNSGDAAAYDLALSVTLPTGFSYVPGTAAVSTSPATPGLAVSASQAGAKLTFTLTLGGTAYDLPAGASITISYGLKTAVTVTSGTYQPTYSRDYALTDGGALVGPSTTQQNILVQAGDTTVNVTPKQQTRAVGDTADFTVTVTNTGLGGIFNVTIDESSIYPQGNNLQFASLAKTAPALAAASSNGGSVLTLPYLAPGDSFTADVTATVLSCGTIVNNVSSVHLANQTPVSDSAPVQLDLRQPLVAYTPPAVTLDYNNPVTVTIPVNNTGLGSAYGFKLQSTLNTLPLNVTNVAAGWTYSNSTGLFTYTAGTIANGGSATLSFEVAPKNVCTASGAGTVNYIAQYTNGCGDAYVIPQQSQSIAAAADTPALHLDQTVSASRIAILESGTYTLTLSADNLANISTSTIVVTDTLPSSVTYVGSTPGTGSVSVTGQVVTWTVSKAALSSSQTLAIDFSVNNDPCNAGNSPVATATTSATSVKSCPLNATAPASFFISNNPGLAASQYFNVTPAPDGLYETGNASSDLVRDAGEGEFIPLVASYTFGAAYPGTWSGSTYADAFGGVPGMVLVGATGSQITVTGSFGTKNVPAAAITSLNPGFSINLAFLAGSGYFNDANVAGHTVTFNYKTTAPDSAVNPGSTRAVTQVTNFKLAGAGTGTSGGCNTPTQSTFTQGAFYTLGRAAAGVGIGMNGAIEVCKPETLTLTVSNTDAKDARNVLVTLLNSSSDFTYNPAQTPVYGGAFTSGNITYNANGGANPTFTYTGNPLTASGTIKVTVTPKATGSTTLAGFSAKVAYDSSQTQAAGSRVYSATAGYSPSSVKKANLAVNVTPGSLTVTGPTISYVTYVSNTDAGTAYGATLANTLPPGITLNTTATNAANPGHPVTAAGQNLTWALGDIASGVTVPITLVADVGVIPGCSLNITTERITATWGCDASVYSTVSKVPPSFVFPAGKMQVVHDSTQTVARLCDLGKIVVVVKNTGPTNIQGVVVSDVVPPSAGLSISGTVQYRVNGGSLHNALGAPSGDGSAGNPYVWTSAQIPDLAQLVPVGVTGANQISIEFALAATETLASQSPVLSASATATISCGNTVSSPAQPFTIPVERPALTVTKTGRNTTANPSAPFGSTVYGGYQDDVEWKIVIANNGTATASNVRLSDQLSGSGGAAVINGPGLAANTAFAPGQVIAIPDIAANTTATYTITEVLGNTCLTSSRTADVTWGCSSNGATTRSDVSTPGSPTDSATIAMTPVIVSGSELTQTFTTLNGGRAKVTVTFTNDGGTAYNPVVTATIPAGFTRDATGPVTFTSDNASITGVSRSGTDASPVFTFTGPSSPRLVRYGETATVSYYVRPTLFDTTSAGSFPNLAGPETAANGLDPSPPASVDFSARLDYTDSCNHSTSPANTVTYHPLTPDLDINLTYPGDVLLTGTGAQNYVFTITNNGDAGSVADFIHLDLPGLGAGWTVNSIKLTTAGTGGTGAGATISPGGEFTPAQVGTLAKGASAVVTVNAQYSGTPGPLTLRLRARGEARSQDGATYNGDYSLDVGGIRVVGVTVTKTLQSTSETVTTGSNVNVGEEATFRLRAAFFGTEGDITNLVIRDTPATSGTPGLAYVSHAYTGANQITPDSVTVGGSAPAPVAVPATLAASRIQFNLATLPAAGVNAGNSVFEADVTTRVLNIAGNNENASLPNNLGVSFTYLGQTFASNNTADGLGGGVAGLHAGLSPSLTVHLPAPTLTKTVRNRGSAGTLTPAFASSATGQAGDVIEYRVVVSNPAGTERPIHNLVVSDPVNADLVLSTTAGQFGVDSAGGTTINQSSTAAAITGNTITFTEANTVYGAAGGNLTRLDPGQSIVFLYRGTLAASVTPSEVLGTTAKLVSYSVPVDGSFQAVHQSSPKGTAAETNSGGTSATAARVLTATGSATLAGDAIAQTKSIVTTSNGNDTATAVLIGEQIRYRLTVQLPQATIPDLVVRDTLPTGLALVSTPAVTIGGAISSGNQPTITPGSLPQNGGTVTWAFGGRTVAAADVADRTITIEYIAQVRNIAGNAAGTSLKNNAAYSYNGSGGAFTAVTPVTVTVQAPNVTVTRGVRNATRNSGGPYVASIAATDTIAPDAGDLIEYQITIKNNSGSNISSAYDFAIQDTLPAGLIYVDGWAGFDQLTGVTPSSFSTFEPDKNGQVLTWGRGKSSPVNIDIAPGGTLTFHYRAKVADTGKPLQAYTNATVVDWTSLDGNPVTNPDLGVALASPGADLGERNGTGTAPNTYRATGNTPVTARNGTTITKAESADTLPRTGADALGASPSGFRIGDIVTYTMTIPVQEGTLDAFKVTDALPAGLAFLQTVSITPAAGTAPFTSYTTPVAGATAPSPGATGTLTWDFGTLVNTGDNDTTNNTLTIVYTARLVDPSGIAATPADQTLNNSAKVSYQKADATTLTSAASVSPVVARQPRLTLAKDIVSPAADSLGNYVRRPGDTASFRLTVTNTGTAPAYNLKLTDTLPAGMRATAPVLTAATLNGADVLATLTAATWTAAAGTYVFDLADAELLLPGQTLVLTYTVTIDNDNALKGATLTNSATINQFFSLPSGNAEAASRRQYAAVGPATRPIVIGLRIDGSVYNDANTNNAKDGGEDWSGATKPTVYANLVTTGGTPAVYQTVTVNPGTGAFTFDYVPPGSYTVVVTNSATATAASRPANWLFQSPATGSIAETLSSATGDLTAQDLGLSQGSYAAPAIAKARSGATLPTAAPADGYRIGDLITYTVDINPQEGALTAFVVTDVLPAGLAYDTSVATTYTQVSGPSRYTYTAPVAGTTAPANGATGTLTWTFGNFTNAISGPVNNSTPSAIAAGNTLRITYHARVRDNATGTSPAVVPIAVPAVSPATTSTPGLVNSAQVGYNNPAPLSAAASAGPVTTSIDVEQPRLTIAKTRTAPTPGDLVVPGGAANFQITVTNDGTAPAYDTLVTDTLPAGMRGAAPSALTATLNGGAVTLTPVWTSGAGTYVFTLTDAQLIQPGQSLVINYTATVDSAATRGALLTNTAALTRYYSKPASDTTQRRSYTPGLSATASVTVGIQVSGFVYNDANASNAKDAGEDWSGAAKPAVYVNLLQSGAVVASYTVNPGTGAFSFTNLPAGDYDLIATDSATSTTPTRPTNWPFQNPSTGKLSLTLSNADLTAQNFGLYQGSLSAPVIAKAKSGDTLPLSAPAAGFRIGDLVTYTIDIQPQEGALTSFQVADTLPAGLAFVATTSIAQVSGPARYTYTAPVDGSTGPTAGATGAIAWNFGAFTNAALGMADNTLRITYTARIVDSGGVAAPSPSPATTSASRANSAAVSYDKPAPDAGPKSAGPATAAISVEQPRLTLAKTRLLPAADNIVMPGATARFRLTVTNDGTAPAYDVALADTLPAGLRVATPVLDAATLNGADILSAVTPSYSAATGKWTVTLTDAQVLLPAGQTLVLDYTVTVDADAPKGSALANSALVTAYASKASADTAERRIYPATAPSTQSLIVGMQVSGSVYDQLIPNGVKDAGTEDWTGGPTVVVNLVTNSAVNYGGFTLGANQVLRSVTVPAGPGDFTFANVPAGAYRIVVTDTAANTVASVPATWTFDTPATGAITPLTVSNADLSGQDLGLYQGRIVSGSVYNDTAPFGTHESETWASGTTVVVNLVNIYGTPVVYATQTVPAGSGAYSFTGVPPGSYRLVVAPAGQTTATAAAAPTAWVFVGPADGTRDHLTLTTADLTAQDFGLTPGRAISGFVYNDTTPNGMKDSFEDWLTGTPVYVNLVKVSDGSIFASASVGIGPGDYRFDNVPPGDFRIVLTNASGSSTVAAPPTWLFRSPPTGSLLVTVAGADLTGENFGLFRGRTASGVVFRDSGVGGGTPNDGVRNGAEPGIPNVLVRLIAGTTLLDTAQTDGAGAFSLRIPADTVAGATLIVEEVNPPAYLSTGGSAGYARATDRITFTFPDDNVTGLAFGDVPENAFNTDGAQTVLPGAAAFYRHTYIAGTGGTVTFTLASTATPSIPWARVLVRDLDANGQADPGEPVIDGVPLVVAAGDQINLVVKDTSPSGAPSGAVDKIVISAAFAYTNASPAINDTRTRQDVTTVGTTGTAGLQLVKSVDKTIAAPGEVITYTVTYTNAGAAPLNTLFIDDHTPDYTVMAEAVVPGTLPASLTAVAITQPAVGATGSIHWDFTGTLDPGASGTVVFKVQVQ